MEISPPFSVETLPAESIPPALTVREEPLVVTSTPPPTTIVPPLFTVMPPLLFTWKPLGVFRTPPETVNELKCSSPPRGMMAEESTDANVPSVQTATDPCPPNVPDARAPGVSRKVPPSSVTPFAVPPLRTDCVPPPATVRLIAVPETICSPLTAEPFTVVSVRVPPEAEAPVSMICLPARRPPSVALWVPPERIVAFREMPPLVRA